MGSWEFLIVIVTLTTSWRSLIPQWTSPVHEDRIRRMDALAGYGSETDSDQEESVAAAAAAANTLVDTSSSSSSSSGGGGGGGGATTAANFYIVSDGTLARFSGDFRDGFP